MAVDKSLLCKLHFDDTSEYLNIIAEHLTRWITINSSRIQEAWHPFLLIVCKLVIFFPYPSAILCAFWLCSDWKLPLPSWCPSRKCIWTNYVPHFSQPDLNLHFASDCTLWNTRPCPNQCNKALIFVMHGLKSVKFPNQRERMRRCFATIIRKFLLIIYL